MELPLITIGIVSFQDKKYLKYTLKQLERIDYPNFEIFIFDNNPDEDIFHWISGEFPDIKIFRVSRNLGFGSAHNELIDRSKADFYLCLNSDIYTDRDFLKQLMFCMQKDAKIACVTGKLMTWRNFPDPPQKQKKQHIDTTGLVIYRNHNVVDRGQNEEDKGKYEKEEEIWGASAAACLYRTKALRDIAYNRDEYFDKDFFMYKEDVDLAYRLRWAGWKVFYTPKSLAWHDRTTISNSRIVYALKNRKNRAYLIKEQSFLNQLLFVYKNWSKEYSLNTKVKTGLFLLKYLLYVLFFETKLLVQLARFWRSRPIFLQKRKKMIRRLSSRAMEKYFQ